MTVTGINFGTNDFSLRLVVGSSDVSQITWTSDTTMTALVAPGVINLDVTFRGLDALIDIDTVRGGTLTGAFFYDPPVVSSIKIQNGPATGGTYISVYGKNFGTIDYSTSVNIGDLDCVSRKWKSVSLICILIISCELSALCLQEVSVLNLPRAQGQVWDGGGGGVGEVIRYF